MPRRDILRSSLDLLTASPRGLSSISAERIGLEIIKSWFCALYRVFSVLMAHLDLRAFMGLRSLDGISGGLKMSFT